MNIIGSVPENLIYIKEMPHTITISKKQLEEWDRIGKVSLGLVKGKTIWAKKKIKKTKKEEK